MKNRALGILLSFAMIIGMMPLAVFAETYENVQLKPSDGFVYTIDTDGRIWVTKYVGSDTEVVLHTMVTYEGVPYTQDDVAFVVGSDIFAGKTNIKKVAIPNGYEAISGDAFKDCTGLVEIAVADDVSLIGTNAFAGCENVQTYYISADRLKEDYGQSEAVEQLISSGLAQDENGDPISGTTIYTKPESPVIDAVSQIDPSGQKIKVNTVSDPYRKNTVGEYKLWVGDTQVTSENVTNITGSDPVQASYDADSNTLTLNNYTYEGFGADTDDVKAAIKARMDADFTINLTGDNTVKHVYKETSTGAGIYADNNVNITGDGTLTVSDGDNADAFNSRGIRVGKELTIGSGATVNASSSSGSNSYGVNVKKLTVQGELNGAGGSANNSYGVYADNDITVSEGGVVNAAGGTATNVSSGVFIKNKSPSITIEGAMVAKGNTYAIAKGADPNPNVYTAAIQYEIPEDYIAAESEYYDGSNLTAVEAGENTSASAKYVQIKRIAPITDVSLNKTSTSLMAGEAETLTAILKPRDAAPLNLVWETTDPNVAKVNQSGEVTAVAAGKATITVRATNGTDDTADDKSATCEVTVTEKTAPKPTPSATPAKAATSVTVNTATVSTKSLNAAVKKAGGTKKSVKTIVLGKKVKKISKGAFKNYKNAKTLVIKTKKLKKAKVKNSLKGSKITKIKVKVGSKKLNKSYVKKYKKIFTKKNAGKKVKVTQ